MKFRFRLDGLLRVRRFELRRRIATLAEKRREHDELAAREQAETAESARAETSSRLAVEAGSGATRIHSFADLASVWRRLSFASGAAAAQAELVVARERSAMLAARTRVEALERLRERRVARWRSEQQRREQRDLDELGTRSFRREGGFR